MLHDLHSLPIGKPPLKEASVRTRGGPILAMGFPVGQRPWLLATS